MSTGPGRAGSRSISGSAASPWPGPTSPPCRCSAGCNGNGDSVRPRPRNRPRPRPERRFRPGLPGAPPEEGSVVVDQESADVAAVQQVTVALVDLVEPVPGGDQLVQLEPAGAVQVEHQRDVVERVAAAEQRALQPLLEQRELEAGELDVLLAGPGQPGHDHRAV